MITRRAEEDLSSGGWIRSYIDSELGRLGDRIDALKELQEQRANAAEKTLEVAKASLNEMRGMASDQATRFMTTASYEGKHEALVNLVTQNSKDVTELKAKGVGYANSWGVITAVGILAIGIIGLYLHNH